MLWTPPFHCGPFSAGGEVTVASVTLRSHFSPPCLGTPGSISLRLQRSAGTDSSRRLPCASPLPHVHAVVAAVSGEWGWGAVGQTVHDRSTPAALQPNSSGCLLSSGSQTVCSWADGVTIIQELG